MKALLAKGAIVDRTSGWSPLHYAAAAGSSELVDLFIKKGANVNVRTKSGVTPLFMAARIANRPCIERLLKAGARKDLCNDHGQSPADMSARIRPRRIRSSRIFLPPISARSNQESGVLNLRIP